MASVAVVVLQLVVEVVLYMLDLEVILIHANTDHLIKTCFYGVIKKPLLSLEYTHRTLHEFQNSILHTNIINGQSEGKRREKREEGGDRKERDIEL